MGSFSKKFSRVTIFIENFFSNEIDVLSIEKTKSGNHCQLATTIWMYSQITYVFQKLFSKRKLNNELPSTIWKFPNVNRNVTSLVVRLKTAQPPLQKEQQTPVLQRLTSMWSQKKLCHVFHRHNLKSSHSDFLHVRSKFNVLVQFAKTLPKASIKTTIFSTAVCRSDCLSKNFHRNKLPHWKSVVTWTFWVFWSYILEAKTQNEVNLALQ